MPQYFAVQHPFDPAAPGFDFWGWRLQRRFLVDRLRALSHVEVGPIGLSLGQCAIALETETFSEREATIVRDYASAWYPTPGTSQRELFLVLAELTRQKEAELVMHWKLPVIRPVWDEVPFNRDVFVGRVNDVTLRAKLPETPNVVPPYELIWILPNGREERLAIRGSRVGLNLEYAAGVWDWLFARRLTLVCQSGGGPWPTPEASPLVIPPSWRLPAAGL